MTKLSVSTIPPTTRFLPDLAAGIFEMAGGLGPDLTRFRILLPTRRAVRALRAEFLNLSGGKPLLLPRMNPLGDIDQEELDLMIAGTVEADAISTVPPALSPLARQMMLTALIQKKDPDLRGEQCLSLARALGRLMDQVYTEDLNLAELPHLVEAGSLADHWSQTVEFLTILSETWPFILQEEGRIDAADRRNRLLKMLSDFWSAHPPTSPVIAAGSTGSIPATGRLLHVIAGMPQGHVILPGLDLDMDEESWKNIGETHPQNTMKRLLDQMGFSRNAVGIWRKDKPSFSPRLEIARAATCPAETCDSFSIEKEKLEAGLKNISLLEAENARHEAQLIALAVRESLETPGRDCVIITPDRNLARRITASLKRWGVNVDDSAGQALHMKPAGIFFNRILACLADDFAPLPLLDLLKTSYLIENFGRSAVSLLELHALRGPRPAPGFDGLKNHIDAEDAPLIDSLENAFRPLLPFAKGNHDFPALLKALTETAENLAGDRNAIWQKDDGKCLALLLSELQDTQSFLPPADLMTHQSYLKQFMSERMVRPSYGTHPRVTILGQIEARLISADLVIMAGLNEGVWPPEPPVDPWMSRPMRKRFGLPPTERQTGLSAHDFVQAFCADQVILTRARKMDGTPTVPARWLERLTALLKNTGQEKDYLTRNAPWAAWQKELDAPQEIRVFERPKPSPPLEARPKKLGVTGIEKLMRNPYEIYARYVLGLKPLKPIDEDVSAADRGEFIHDILNEFVTAHPDKLPPNAETILLEMGEEKLAELGEISPAWLYWWPRYRHLVPAFLEQERKWRKNARFWRGEIQGSCDFTFNGAGFTLTAKADRIDRESEGAAIIDYKTGAAPSARDVVKGKSPQLPLEAMLLMKGGFEGLTTGKDNISMSYWTLTGKQNPIDIATLGDSKIRVNGKNEDVVPSDVIAEAEDGFTRLMTAFLSDATPYLPVIPASNRLYEDEKAYKHLARCDEWGIAGDADQEEAG